MLTNDQREKVNTMCPVARDVKLGNAIPVKVKNQVSSTASTVEALVTDFNALLTKLKTAGIMEEDVGE